MGYRLSINGTMRWEAFPSRGAVRKLCVKRALAETQAESGSPTDSWTDRSVATAYGPLENGRTFLQRASVSGQSQVNEIGRAHV